MNSIRQYLAAALVAVALPVQAGFYYEAHTVTQSDQMGTETATVHVWVDGTNARIEFSEDSDFGFGSDSSYLLTRDGGENMILVDPEEQAYTEFNLGQTANMAAAMMEKMGGMFQFSFEDPYAEKLSEGPGEPILGYDTRKFEFRSGYTMNMSMMGRNMGQKVDSTSTMWVTSEIDAAAFDAWLRPDKRLKGIFEGLDEIMANAYGQIEGVPLKTVMNTTTTDAKGKVSKSEMVTDVIVLREEDVPAERFAIPEGYQKTELSMAAKEDDEQEGSAAEEGLKALKGLFGGKKDD